MAKKTKDEPAPEEEPADEKEERRKRKDAKAAKKRQRLELEEEVQVLELALEKKRQRLELEAADEAVERKRKKEAKRAKKEAEAAEEAAAEERRERKEAKAQKKKKEAEMEEEEVDVVPKVPKASVQEAAPTGRTFKVFIGGLPSHVDEAMLKKDFAECGEISELLISRWPEDGSSRGMCFITWATEAAMRKCLAWHDVNYEGKYIRVEERKGVDKKDKPRGGGPSTKPPGCRSVAVFDLAPSVGEDELHEFFGKCGSVSNTRILKNRETGESRGIGFVEFEVTGATDQAVLLSGTSFAGKPIKVEFAKDAGDKGKGKGKGKSSDGTPSEKPDGCVAVVIRQMSTLVTEDDLWRLFSDCKSASNISILMDNNTFQSRGIAFVDFDDTTDTDIAVKKSGKLVCGQAVSIDYKMPK